MIIWASNAQVARRREGGDESLAQALDLRFPSEPRCVGILAATGEVLWTRNEARVPIALGTPARGSLEWLLGEAAMPLYFLDVRGLPESGPVRDALDEGRPMRHLVTGASLATVNVALPRAFDGVLFVQSVTRPR